MKARIAEVFDSVQGEGLYFGERQLFVRFFGCNLNCKFCDTRTPRFSEYKPDELFRELKLYKDDYHSVSFTGGEPLLYADFLKETLKLTSRHGLKSYLETNGMLWPELKSLIKYVDIVAMDVKLPSSSGMGQLWGFHKRFLEIAAKKEVFIKTVVSVSTQVEELEEVIKLIKRINRGITLVLQPNTYDGYGRLKHKLGYFQYLCMSQGVASCVIPQMHKFLGLK